jgi:hypothetical protein
MSRFTRSLPAALWLLLLVVKSPAQSAVLHATSSAVHIEITVGRTLREGERPKAALFAVRGTDRIQIKELEELVPQSSPPNRYILAFPVASQNRPRFDLSGKYEVLLLVPTTDPDGASVNLMSVLAVSRELIVTVARGDVDCRSGIAVTARSVVRSYDWERVFEWLSEFRPTEKQPELATLKIKVLGETKDYPLSSFHTSAAAVAQALDRLFICLQPSSSLPTEKFGAEVEFHGNAPVELTQPLKATGLAPEATVPIAKEEGIKEPLKRKLERNLDVGISLTSSVAEIPRPASASLPAAAILQRTNRGVLDLRFAPWLNVLNTPFVENRSLWFLTPFFVNANVATGKIVKDTLGLNQILVGAEGEWRYYQAKTVPDASSQIGVREVNPITHRLIGGLVSSSDRDFKQADLTGKIDYIPLLDALNRPLALNWKPDGSGGQIFGRFGYAVRPKVGVEVGRTYLRRNPAAAIKTSDVVRRLALGSEVALDLSRYLSLSATDTFYVRYETSTNRYRNYFKAQIEGGIGEPNGYKAQSVFVSFERGQLPPFSLPNVNAFKIGYRIRGDFWNQPWR